MHSCSNVFIGHGHVLGGWREHTLHQGALALQVVVNWRCDRQVCKAAEVCIGAVQQIVQP